MAFSCMVGGTLAYLTATTSEVKNTFTVGNVNIGLTESENLDLKIVPGKTITKDPKATVKAGSESSWLVVKIVESTDPDFDAYMTYTIAEGWTEYGNENDSGERIIYRAVDGVAETDQDYEILKDNQVMVKGLEVTKPMIDELQKTGQYPELTFMAYAIQKDSINDIKTALKELGLISE